MRTFDEFAAQCDLQRVPSGGSTTCYQFKTPLSNCGSHEWGMSCAFHFNKGLSVSNWVALRNEVATCIGGDLGLRAFVGFVPYSEIGLDFVVQSKPPYDGGYFLASLNEWRTYADTGRPPDGCEASNELLHTGVLRVLAGLPDARRELLDHTIRTTFTNDPGSQVLFIEDRGWSVYELTVHDEWMHLLAN